MNDQLSQVRSDALVVLRDMLHWRLPPARWEEIKGVLDSLERGLGQELALADPEQLAALSQATITLELAGPVRITRISAAGTAMPDAIRDRVNHLIHDLAIPEQPADPRADSEDRQ
jgi:hypothetical protein